MVYDLWFMVYGLWFMVYGLGFRVQGRLLGRVQLRPFAPPAEREFFIGNLLVRIHLTIEMISVDRPCAI